MKLEFNLDLESRESVSKVFGISEDRFAEIVKAVHKQFEKMREDGIGVFDANEAIKAALAVTENDNEKAFAFYAAGTGAGRAAELAKNTMRKAMLRGMRA